MNRLELINKIENVKARSQWKKGVKTYALELLNDLYYIDELDGNIEKILLNGASSWVDFSWGGCSLIYDFDIAQRLCNNSELKRTNNAKRKPNKNEQWLDTQARALYQAYLLIKNNI